MVLFLALLLEAQFLFSQQTPIQEFRLPNTALPLKYKLDLTISTRNRELIGFRGTMRKNDAQEKAPTRSRYDAPDILVRRGGGESGGRLCGREHDKDYADDHEDDRT